MISLSVLDAVAAAGLHAHNKPWDVLHNRLLKLGVIPKTPAGANELVPSYDKMNWNRQSLQENALTLKKQRRTDPITAKVASLHKDIDATVQLSYVDKESLKEDVRSIYQTDYGRYQEKNCYNTFKKVTANSVFSPETHKQLLFVGPFLPKTAKDRLKAKMTLLRTFTELGVSIQGLPDMLDCPAIFEMKNRLYAEDQMTNDFRKADHAQLMGYLVLAEHIHTFGHSAVGYLVEQMRVGGGTRLKLEFREEPYVAAQQTHVNVGELEAGHMVITKYTLQQARSYWDTTIKPELAKFCRLLDRLMVCSDLVASYMQAADKQVWYQQHSDIP